MVMYKKAIIGLGIAKFVQNTMFCLLYFNAYEQGMPTSPECVNGPCCESTWLTMQIQISVTGPLLGIAVIGYLLGVCCESFMLFVLFFILHAILGLFAYTPLIVMTGQKVLTGDGILCYAGNPDEDSPVILIYVLQVWLYWVYTAMMCGILYLSCGKVLISKWVPGLL